MSTRLNLLMPHLPILKILGKDPIWLMWLTWCLLLGGEWAWGMIQPASTHEPPLGTGVGKYGGLGHDIGRFGAVKGSPMLIDGWYSSVPRQAKIGWENIVIAQLFLGSEPDRGQSPVEWGDFLYVRLFVRLFVRPPLWATAPKRPISCPKLPYFPTPVPRGGSGVS